MNATKVQSESNVCEKTDNILVNSFFFNDERGDRYLEISDKVYISRESIVENCAKRKAYAWSLHNLRITIFLIFSKNNFL